MGKRLVTGELRRADDSPMAGVKVAFHLILGSYDAQAIRPEDVAIATTDSAGQFQIYLWINAGFTPSYYLCRLPDKSVFQFSVPDGVDAIALTYLRELADGKGTTTTTTSTIAPTTTSTSTTPAPTTTSTTTQPATTTTTTAATTSTTTIAPTTTSTSSTTAAPTTSTTTQVTTASTTTIAPTTSTTSTTTAAPTTSTTTQPPATTSTTTTTGTTTTSSSTTAAPTTTTSTTVAPTTTTTSTVAPTTTTTTTAATTSTTTAATTTSSTTTVAPTTTTTSSTTAPSGFDTTIAGPGPTQQPPGAGNITWSSGSTETFSYTNIANVTGQPVTMQVRYLGTVYGSATYLSGYGGQPFGFTMAGSTVVRTGVFASSSSIVDVA